MVDSGLVGTYETWNTSDNLQTAIRKRKVEVMKYFIDSAFKDIKKKHGGDDKNSKFRTEFAEYLNCTTSILVVDIGQGVRGISNPVAETVRSFQFSGSEKDKRLIYNLLSVVAPYQK